MTLLIDKLDIAAFEAKMDDEEYEGLGYLLRARQEVVEISNVADLVTRTSWLARDENDSFTIDYSKFPNVAPPFESYWLDWRVPAEFNQWERQALGRVGAWCEVTDRTDDDQWVLGVSVWAGQRKPVALAHFALAIDRRSFIASEYVPVEMMQEAHTFFKPDQRVIDANTENAEEIIALGDEFKSLTRAEQLERLEAMQDDARKQLEATNDQCLELYGRYLRIVVLPPLLMAHSLLGCKNVSTEDHTPDPKLARANLRRRGTPMVTYKTLAIRPMGGNHAPAERVSIGNGQTALHLVRGHFKTFTPERPLFGSRVGTYWWSPNVRGKAENGVVVKDYELSAAVGGLQYQNQSSESGEV